LDVYPISTKNKKLKKNQGVFLRSFLLQEKGKSIRDYYEAVCLRGCGCVLIKMQFAAVW
jgi:hypothetical protein